MAQSSTVSFQVYGTLTSPLDLSTPVDTLDYLKQVQLDDGTSTGQASNRWHDQRTVASSTNDNLDLSGSLTNSFGVTLNFARIKAIGFYGSTANGTFLQIGGSTSNTWPLLGSTANVFRLYPGSAVWAASPDVTSWAVTAGTGDILQVLSTGGASMTYDIIVIGSTA